MSEEMQKALAVICNPAGCSRDEYLDACACLVKHRNFLPYPVFVYHPDGALTDDDDPRWEEVVAASEVWRYVGERVILPLECRTEFEASEEGQIIVSAAGGIYLKPLGGDRRSTCHLLRVEEGMLVINPFPFAPFVSLHDIFTARSFLLDEIAGNIEEHPNRPVLGGAFGDVAIPVCRIDAVDLEAQTVTITPDRAMEVFEKEKPSQPSE